MVEPQRDRIRLVQRRPGRANRSVPRLPPRYTFTDHLGTPLIQTDPAGTIVWRAEYEPFGNVFTMRAGTRDEQPLRFPGQEAAMSYEGAEENYNVFRWYRSGWGRYTQADRAGVLASLNLYAYVDGNPLRWTDPKGLYRVEPPSGPRSEEINRAIFDLYRRINVRRPCCDADTASRLMGFLSSPNLVFEYDADLPICATVSDEIDERDGRANYHWRRDVDSRKQVLPRLGHSSRDGSCRIWRSW